MSRTFPRAVGAMPAKCVSRIVCMEGLTATNQVPPTDDQHFSARGREVQPRSGGNRWKKMREELLHRVRYAAPVMPFCGDRYALISIKLPKPRPAVASARSRLRLPNAR